jgi:uncharacterized SAM-binding protein YcdF (DUF218 family)
MKPPHQPRFRPFLRDALPRGLALFLGGFCLLNLLGNLRSPRLDATLWLLDLRFAPQVLARPFLALSALCLIGFGLRAPRSTWRRFLTTGCLAALAVVALANTLEFYVLLARHNIRAGVAVPFSLFVMAALAAILAAALRPGDLPAGPRRQLPTLAVVLGCCFLFPLAQMFCFGKTDYRRPADVAVVLGARAYADGRPSDALADRVRTACQLYQAGLARKLLFSGGPGDGPVRETEAMRQMALRLGVRAEDILVDEAGLNTLATVKNSEPVFARLHASRILVVSHFYHLPRIKLTYQRDGLEVYTVPARETYLLRQTPYNMAREVAALWVYYLRPLAG